MSSSIPAFTLGHWEPSGSPETSLETTTDRQMEDQGNDPTFLSFHLQNQTSKNPPAFVESYEPSHGNVDVAGASKSVRFALVEDYQSPEPEPEETQPTAAAEARPVPSFETLIKQTFENFEQEVSKTDGKSLQHSIQQSDDILREILIVVDDYSFIEKQMTSQKEAMEARLSHLNTVFAPGGTTD